MPNHRSAALAAATTVAAAAVAAFCHSIVRRRRQQAADVAEVLSFWFEGEASVLFSTRWFVPPNTQAQAAVDADVRERFGALRERAERGELEAWSDTPQGCAALIVVLDQCTTPSARASTATMHVHSRLVCRVSPV